MPLRSWRLSCACSTTEFLPSSSSRSSIARACRSPVMRASRCFGRQRAFHGVPFRSDQNLPCFDGALRDCGLLAPGTESSRRAPVRLGETPTSKCRSRVHRWKASCCPPACGASAKRTRGGARGVAGPADRFFPTPGTRCFGRQRAFHGVPFRSDQNLPCFDGALRDCSTNPELWNVTTSRSGRPNGHRLGDCAGATGRGACRSGSHAATGNSIRLPSR
jgi:hypothetical protein